MIPLVAQVPRTEPDHDEDGPMVREWLEDLYVCPEHGETFCGAPVPAETHHFCEACAEAIPRRVSTSSREPHEDRELRYRENTITGRPAW